jgi:hypothetical protein
MTQKRTRNVAASVRQQLLNLRRTKNEDYNAILTQFVIERFLYRLSKSPLSRQFVLKGAMLFRAWSGELHRPTKDLDLLGTGEPWPDAVANAVQQIIATKVSDDGLTFLADTVLATEIRGLQEYGGVRVKLTAMLGTARLPMQLDVGFGDAITPEPSVQAFPTLLEMDRPKLRMYPVETVVAEKCEAVVILGMANSRMKDFYDLWVIFRSYEPSDDVMVLAIAATFKCRQTELPIELPIGFSDEFGQDATVQRLWQEFLRRLQIDDVPASLAEVISSVRDRIWPIMVQARRITNE